ncbi:hypothetical protein N0V82_009679 [Gnomoniopsis sp. IMI 355080]|nr:hypothetical protein N0V82_009679 [Gnomoniopsis sp. IMI 355080]
MLSHACLGALVTQDLETVHFLLETIKVDVMGLNQWNTTALWCIANVPWTSKNLKTVEELAGLLIRHGSNVFHGDVYGESPLERVLRKSGISEGGVFHKAYLEERTPLARSDRCLQKLLWAAFESGKDHKSMKLLLQKPSGPGLARRIRNLSRILPCELQPYITSDNKYSDAEDNHALDLGDDVSFPDYTSESAQYGSCGSEDDNNGSENDSGGWEDDKQTQLHVWRQSRPSSAAW